MAKVTVTDISGMGGREFGGYEWGCQVVAHRTLRFLQKLQNEGQYPAFKGFEGVVGLIVADNPAAKELDAYILQHEKLKEYGMTGAMHQFGIAHGKALFELGREKYLAELREAGRTNDDFYEFDEDDAFPELQSAA